MLIEKETTLMKLIGHFNTCLDNNYQRKNLAEKGGTVVPPSKFHFGSTEETESQSVIEKTPRPRGSARAHAGESPIATTSISDKK